MKTCSLWMLMFCGAAFAADEMSVERLDPALDKLIPKDAEIKVLTTGYKWMEGPVWNEETGELLFSDVPNNVIYAWNGKEVREFMRPSGYTGVEDYGKEAGSNGLTFDAKGQLVLAEHGDRRVSVLTKNGGKMTLADRYEGKRFNSPNDVVVHSSGAVYFTDPIYGLPKGEDDPSREIDFCGVYRIGTDGQISLVTKDLERPNGLAFSPDEKTIYSELSRPEGDHPCRFHQCRRQRRGCEDVLRYQGIGRKGGTGRLESGRYGKSLGNRSGRIARYFSGRKAPRACVDGKSHC